MIKFDISWLMLRAGAFNKERAWHQKYSKMDTLKIEGMYMFIKYGCKAVLIITYFSDK